MSYVYNVYIYGVLQLHLYLFIQLFCTLVDQGQHNYYENESYIFI